MLSLPACGARELAQLGVWAPRCIHEHGETTLAVLAQGRAAEPNQGLSVLVLSRD